MLPYAPPWERVTPALDDMPLVKAPLLLPRVFWGELNDLDEEVPPTCPRPPACPRPAPCLAISTPLLSAARKLHTLGGGTEARSPRRHRRWGCTDTEQGHRRATCCRWRRPCCCPLGLPSTFVIWSPPWGRRLGLQPAPELHFVRRKL